MPNMSMSLFRRSRAYKLLTFLLLVSACIATIQAPRGVSAESQVSSLTLPPLVRGSAGDLWADTVIGKPDFTGIGPYTTTSNKLFWPHGAIVDRSSTPNKLYVYDAGNNRILGFDLSKCLSGPTNPANCSADIVIG